MYFSTILVEIFSHFLSKFRFKQFKMVRKRAQAQKALSPPRDTESNHIDSNRLEEEERPNKRSKMDEESNSSDNNDNGMFLI